MASFQGPKGDSGQTGATGSTGAVMPWSAVSTSTVMSKNSGYIVSGGGTEELTLPASPVIGDVDAVRQGADATDLRILIGATGQRIEGYAGLAGAGRRH